MSSLAALQANLLSPITLAFALGILARLARSEISLPRDLSASLAIYLLFALGLKGGVELSHAAAGDIAWPIAATLLLGCITPLTAYLGMRHAGRFSVADSAAVAAHYGSVSAVTFIAAQQYCGQANLEVEGYLPTLLTLMESPGIAIALTLGALGTVAAPATATVGGGGTVALGGGMPALDSRASATRIRRALHEILTGRTMVLLVGGMAVGWLVGERGYREVQPFFEGGFRGALTLFILDMGLVAGERLADLRKAGGFLVGFGIVMPILHGILGAALGHWAGMSVGGSTMLAAMAASASYIAAPPAVRMTLPEANLAYPLTLALGITFPFNIVLGIPLFHRVATLLAAT